MAQPVEAVSVGVFTIPTDRPESDGTLAWDSTTLVLVEVRSGGKSGLGYTYADPSTARLIDDKLRALVIGADAMGIGAVWGRMNDAVRNLGRPGIAAMAISAVDCALWDLKAKLLEVSLSTLLGAVRDDVAIYGSGGFTSYSEAELAEQLGGWAEAGLAAVKMKVGREPARDPDRVRTARRAIGDAVTLMVDANGAYDRKQALAKAEAFAEQGVTWFEEPVSSDDPEGLRLLRDRCPPGMEVSAGEYGYHAQYFRRLLEAGAVDVLQADITRCGGLTGFLQAAALCEAFQIPLSTHTAPSLHLAPACASRAVRHMEWFHDHVRIERMLLDGFVEPVDGRLRPDGGRPGFGFDLRRRDAERFAVS